MGKVEILTLIAGIVLSIALALIVVPMFSSTEDLVVKQKIQTELIAVKNAINMIQNTEASKLNETNVAILSTTLGQYLQGMDVTGTHLKSANIENATIIVTTGAAVTNPMSVVFSDAGNKLSPFNGVGGIFEEHSGLKKICTGGAPTINADAITCLIKR